MTLLAVQRSPCRLRLAAGVCAASDFASRRGHIVALLGVQRRRQDHHAARAVRPDSGARAHRVRRRRSARTRPRGVSSLASPMSRKVAAHSATSASRKTSRSVPHCRSRAQIAADHGALVRGVPASARATAAAGRHPQRRRAADAGDRARSDVPAAPADVRRTLAGAGAGIIARDVLHLRRINARARHHAADRRAERRPHAAHRPHRLCDGGRRDHAAGQGRGTAGRASIHVPIWESDDDPARPTDHRRPRRGGDLCGPGAGAGADLPRHAHRQFRPGRDGDVLRLSSPGSCRMGRAGGPGAARSLRSCRSCSARPCSGLVVRPVSRAPVGDGRGGDAGPVPCSSGAAACGSGEPTSGRFPTCFRTAAGRWRRPPHRQQRWACSPSCAASRLALRRCSASRAWAWRCAPAAADARTACSSASAWRRC